MSIYQLVFKLLLIQLLINSSSLMAQDYPKVSIPDPTKNFDELAHFKIKPYQKKTFFQGHFQYIKKYDTEGRVIMDEEYENDGNRTRTTKTYQGNLLIEEINEKLPAKNFRKEISTYEDGIAIVYDFKREKKIYKTVIDPHTHQIVSGNLYEVQQDSTLKSIVTYMYDNQSRITKTTTSQFNHTNYIYKGSNLVREEHCMVIKDKIYQIRGTEYQYDKNNLLTRIEKFTENALNDKLVRGQQEQIDSLFYKNNQLIERKNQLELYHYDYDTEGHLIHFTYTRVNNKKENTPENIRTYTYRDHILVQEEMQYLPSKITTITDYEYNDLKQLVKTTNYTNPPTALQTTISQYNTYGHLVKTETQQEYNTHKSSFSVGSIFSYTYF